MDERTFQIIAKHRFSPATILWYRREEFDSAILVGIHFEISLDEAPYGFVFIDEPSFNELTTKSSKEPCAQKRVVKPVKISTESQFHLL